MLWRGISLLVRPWEFMVMLVVVGVNAEVVAGGVWETLHSEKICWGGEAHCVSEVHLVTCDAL